MMSSLAVKAKFVHSPIELKSPRRAVVYKKKRCSHYVQTEAVSHIQYS